MKKLTSLKAVFMVFVFCAATTTLALAQDTFTTLVNFDGANGSVPEMVLAQGADGNFYGTTNQGGDNNMCTGGCGTFFKMTPAGTLTTLYNFCSQTSCADGAYPMGSLTQATDGDFYGTTEESGAHGGGTVFKITPRGVLTTLYSFCALTNCTDGEAPSAGLVQATRGKLYGTTRFGGANGGGVVFEITSAGELKTIYSFCALYECADGSMPVGVLIQATNGNLYGETEDGGVNYQGTIFEITPAGKLTTLYSFCALDFCADGSAPYGGLVQAESGDFYGVTIEGGGHCNGGCGTVFKIASTGTLTTLYSFCAVDFCADGRQPRAGLVQGTNGNFYGTTY